MKGSNGFLVVLPEQMHRKKKSEPLPGSVISTSWANIQMKGNPAKTQSTDLPSTR